MNDKCKSLLQYSQYLQYLLPQHTLSHLAGNIANCRTIWLKNWLIKKFIAHYQVNMAEAVEPNPEHYESFNSFFTRPLKRSTRPIAADMHTVVSPVDGRISQKGNIEDNLLIQAKNKSYTLEQLLATKELAETFRHGSFATIYLSPKDYHRVHMPLTGRLRRMIYVPGTLFAVNDGAVKNVPHLFGRNERVVVIFDTFIGPMALVLVGALIVGSISTKWSGTVAPGMPSGAVITSGSSGRVNNAVEASSSTEMDSDSNSNNERNRQIKVWNYEDRELILQRGDEMGRFQLGSTVIVLFPQNTIRWQDELALGDLTKMGQGIGKTI